LERRREVFNPARRRRDAIIKGIDDAKKSVEIVIFRINRREIEKALAAAVKEESRSMR